MTLKVIGAGYPRTGTSSLKLALEQLGFGPCHHMREIIMNPSSAAPWVEAAEGRPDWDAIFDGYQSCTDAPGCLFWRELAEVYPDAKILLSVRDPHAWFESTQATVFSEAMLGMAKGTPLERFFELAVIREFGDRIHDRDFMLAQYERRKQEVMRDAPPERLLVMDVREGWEPLCAFLGVPVPDTPFPRENSREEMAHFRSAAGESGGAPIDFNRLSEMARERFARR